MTCGSKKYIAEALAKIRVQEIEEELPQHEQPKSNESRKRDAERAKSLLDLFFD